MNKYHAKKCEMDGYTFDSLEERSRYGALKLMQRAGIISDLQIHPRFPLIVNGEKIGHITLDFRYLNETGAPVLEDVKGVLTKDASLRIRIFEAQYGTKVSLIGKSAKVRKFRRAA